jgi:hypothetical protein
MQRLKDIEEEAKSKTVETMLKLKICPFFDYAEASQICIGERCQIWDMKNGCCQIENLRKIYEAIMESV